MTNDLFASAAFYYARYRPLYPPELITDIVSNFSLTSQSRVLDIGSGTGQLAMQIAPLVKEVVAVEPDAEMIKEGKLFCEKQAVENVRWMQSRAEDIDDISDLGKFSLVTFGSSFHWMDQPRVLSFLDGSIEKDGGVVIAGYGTVWNSDVVWEIAVKKCLQKHLGEERRAGERVYSKSIDSYVSVLRESAFLNVRHKKYSLQQIFSLDDIIGYLYSTSFANQAVLGEKKEAFEKDVRATLLALEPSGIFHKEQNYFAVFAKR